MNFLKNKLRGTTTETKLDTFCLSVIDNLWTELVSFLDGATYHNFYWKFGQISRYADTNKINNNEVDKVKKCLQFMKYNPCINYLQAIVSIYFVTHIPNWNKTYVYSHYYNIILNNATTISFSESTIYSFLKIFDQSLDEQKRLLSLILNLDKSSFSHMEMDQIYKQDALTQFHLHFVNIKKNNYLINKNNDLNRYIIENMLYDACINGSIEIVELILNTSLNCIDINCTFSLNSNINPSTSTRTFLIEACNAIYKTDRYLDVVKKLLAYGANPNTKVCFPPQTALSAAIENGDIKCAKLLINNNANINDNLSIFYACKHRNDPTLLELLIENGCDINQKYNFSPDADNLKYADSPLKYCMCIGNNKCFDILMKNNAEWDMNDIIWLPSVSESTNRSTLTLLSQYPNDISSMCFCKFAHFS